MSASLVGSEMCIRDRSPLPIELRLVPDSFGEFRKYSERLRLRSGRGSQPVSYTHLTLPTICSV
eukprot:8445063-Alexandrium_andersonii.AAC.1